MGISRQNNGKVDFSGLGLSPTGQVITCADKRVFTNSEVEMLIEKAYLNGIIASIQSKNVRGSYVDCPEYTKSTAYYDFKTYAEQRSSDSKIKKTEYGELVELIHQANIKIERSLPNKPKPAAGKTINEGLFPEHFKKNMLNKILNKLKSIEISIK